MNGALEAIERMETHEMKPCLVTVFQLNIDWKWEAIVSKRWRLLAEVPHFGD